MKAYSPTAGVACYITVPPSYRPHLYTGMQHIGGENLRCFPTHSSRPNLSRIALADGSEDVFVLGPDRNDVTLEITAADDETMQVLEEISRRGIPVCIYPRMEGNVQMHMPLVRGVGLDGDGYTATHTLTLAANSILYLPSADASRMLYMNRVATGGYPLLDGVLTTADNVSIQAPLGRGLYMPSLAKNLLKAPNLGTVSYSAPLPSDGWRWTDGGDTWDTHAGTKASPWHDGYSYWTRSTSNYLSSPKFTLTVTTDKYFLISFCYRVQGSLTAQVYDSAGNPLHGAVTVTHGTGRVQWPVPVITGATSADCTLRFTLASGEYAEIACPQIISAGLDSIGDYFPYLGSDSTSTQPEITASSLKVEGDFGADAAVYSGNGSTWDGYIVASGYAQPGYNIAYKANHTLCFLERYLGAANGDLELRFQPGGSFYLFSLYSGGTLRKSTPIATPRRGELFAWTLWTGRTDGALVSGALLTNMYSGTEYSLGYASGIGYANRLYVGCRSTSGYGADALMSGVTVCSAASVADMRNIHRRMADPENADLFRRTAGRWYTLEMQTSPRRYDRRSWTGTLTGREVKAI